MYLFVICSHSLFVKCMKMYQTISVSHTQVPQPVNNYPMGYGQQQPMQQYPLPQQQHMQQYPPPQPQPYYGYNNPAYPPGPAQPAPPAYGPPAPPAYKQGLPGAPYPPT